MLLSCRGLLRLRFSLWTHFTSSLVETYFLILPLQHHRLHSFIHTLTHLTEKRFESSRLTWEYYFYIKCTHHHFTSSSPSSISSPLSASYSSPAMSVVRSLARSAAAAVVTWSGLAHLLLWTWAELRRRRTRTSPFSFAPSHRNGQPLHKEIFPWIFLLQPPASVHCTANSDSNCTEAYFAWEHSTGTAIRGELFGNVFVN